MHRTYRVCVPIIRSILLGTTQPLTNRSGTNRDNGGNMDEHAYVRAEYARSRCLCERQNCGHNLWMTFSLAWNCDQGAIAIPRDPGLRHLRYSHTQRTSSPSIYDARVALRNTSKERGREFSGKYYINLHFCKIQK